jgi:hypothetical protein
MVRELKESFIPWLSGQLLPPSPSLDTYDELAHRWIAVRVLTRLHRTTKRIVGDAWNEEKPRLNPIPARILASLAGDGVPGLPTNVIDLEQLALGAHADVRDLAEYEAVR